jgi:hypothetical protein
VIIQIVCPYCSFSKSVPSEKIPSGIKRAICPRCKQHFEIPSLEVPQALEATEGDRIPPLWERRSEVGIAKALGGTVKGVLFSPGRFFKTAAVKGGIKEPLVFGILTGSLGMMFEMFWQGVMRPGELPFLIEGSFGRLTGGPLLAGIMILCPLLVTIFLCVASLLLHFLLVIVRGGKNGFEATLRAVSYSQATQIWAVIPFLGSFLAVIWIMVVQLISIREMHEVSYARVILAMSIPFIAVTLMMAAVLIPFLMSI